MTYNLDDLVKIYVPSMSGYADHFNATVDKSKMMECPPETMTDYAGQPQVYAEDTHAGPERIHKDGGDIWVHN